MNIAQQIKLNKKLKLQRTVLMGMTTAVIASNLLLATYLISNSNTVILVPTYINKELSIGQKAVSSEYLEALVRDLAMQMLNLTPENYEYVEVQVLKLVHPAAYWNMKTELDQLGEDIKNRKIAIAFQISEIVVDPQLLWGEVSGYLETRLGSTTTNKEQKRYRFSFDYNVSKLALKEFYEVKDETKGS